MFMCGYSVFCVYRLLRSLQTRILLRPTKVVFSHKKEGETAEELRTVVAYQNPFTGDYCVHKTRAQPQGYINILPSPDSGMSDEYEPLRLQPPCSEPVGPQIHSPLKPVVCDNSVNKTWNWNYKEYQI
ncbi:uncharacterized protein LOC113226234 [Hyposmocoma kahamanoa]|uniref:uncharacterized protein LOC113226234 n=1 Tax=Hyposmocoma kahamanoa TaxID=1477025 RepID=UPI000E6DA536|nr:uncharacterized protein LOC113226234 [Hyposmocoma kahamanoa]